MLYKLALNSQTAPTLEAMPFSDFSALNAVEKDLEALYAGHLLDLLFEEAPLMPMFRERQWQEEADLYALDAQGDLTIFEFKRGMVGGAAVHQLLRYAQTAGNWTFDTLVTKYRTFAQKTKLPEKGLVVAHQEAFELNRPLDPREFNRHQRLWLVGNAADDELATGVEYWKRQGLAIDFVPYRIYTIGEQRYFEVFSPPFDRHSNPGEAKGVLFDTNRSYNEDAIWHMLEKRRVSAFGDTKYVADYLNPHDIVFLSHKGRGIVAACEVIGPRKTDGTDEWYRDMKLLTAVPKRGAGVQQAMSFAKASDVTGKSFFWARTVKVPYLTREEATHLLAELRTIIGNPEAP